MLTRLKRDKFLLPRLSYEEKKKGNLSNISIGPRRIDRESSLPESFQHESSGEGNAITAFARHVLCIS